MEIAQLYEIYKQYPTITTDTRNCPKDSIFFALKGSSFNGNEYAKQALEKGCKYAVVDDARYATNDDNIILVEDVLMTLQQLARYHRSKLRIPVIGITGTNGKTTTKELISAVLSQQFNVLSTQGNLNNHIGVPLTLLRLNKDHEIAVIEMGASHMGEIKFLAEIADPDYGLITNVGRGHIEGFGSFENIIQTKGELYNYLRNRKDAKFFMNYDNSYLRELVQEDLEPIYYGNDESLFVSGKIISADPYLTFSWRFSQNHHKVCTNLIGDYNLTNVLAAVAIGKYFGVKSAKVCEAIEGYTPTNNRSQLKRTSLNTLIIDAYNSNPTSLNAALSNFSKMKMENKVLILGDMKELGETAKIEHENIIEFIAQNKFDQVFLVGEQFSKTESPYDKFLSVNDLINYIKQHPLSGKHILIKGSRSLQLEKCVDLL